MSNQDYINEIKRIRESFSDLVHYTPLELNHTFSVISNNNIYLKLENFQRTGSFKIRGAYNKVSRLTDPEKNAGVITASAGNHGQAVALAAKLFNIKSTIVVPEGAPIVKIEAIKNYNPKGQVIEYGRTYDEAYQKALEIREKDNFVFIPAFNDRDVIKGQATIGLEILEQLSDIDYIFCPIGGGGLISGISSYCKQKNKSIKIIGVQSKNAPSMKESFMKNKISTMELKETICDGIAVKQPGDITYKMIKKNVEDIVLVSDEEVANTILLLLERAKLFVEGAGAAALAAVIHKKIELQNKNIVVIISGGNLTPNLLNRIITKGLIKGGRLVKFKTKLPDIPGALLNVLKIIAEEKGNIISITHDRERLELEYKMTEVIIELETRDFEHINLILTKLKDHFEIEILKF
ncbi:MAG: threonine ammonia-lyase [Promethearchaeota archaeon]|nr:MAG: threonine ammonia-lyase [Candidatus Lokiarchaeota archaeon]